LKFAFQVGANRPALVWRNGFRLKSTRVLVSDCELNPMIHQHSFLLWGSDQENASKKFFGNVVASENPEMEKF
jgi:hypothetical protein